MGRYYIHGLSRVYVGQFKLYVSQLGKLKLENAPTRGDTVARQLRFGYFLFCSFPFDVMNVNYTVALT